MSARLIPERTIDAWTSVAINEVDPDALIWAPTPNAQASNQPWDLAVQAFGSPTKLLAFENKALETRLLQTGWRPSVLIRWDQLLALLELHYLRALPVFYGLPGLKEPAVQTLPPDDFAARAEARYKPLPFAEWQRVLTPGDVLAVLPARARRSLVKNIQAAITAGDPVVKGGGRIPTDLLDGFPTLAEHLDAARDCLTGRLINPTDTGPVLGATMTDADRVSSLGPIVARLALGRELVGEAVAGAISQAAGSVLPPDRRRRVGRHLMRTVWAAVNPTSTVPATSKV
jgi:hypothetical protein